MHSLLFALLITALTPAWAADNDGKPLPAIGTVQVFFTPGQNATAGLVDAIRQARHTVLVQSFSFTSNEIAFALIEAKRRGVDVQVIADAEQTRKLESSKIPLLVQSGLKVWLDEQHQSAHNKVMLIDGESANPVLVTGSMNFTYAAQFKNAENLLILRGNKPLTEAYIANWQRHKQHALPFH
jgi:phosphatidylserine/phosphatidylglycerophosphate/cardiolipin synthase-like enzyme